MTSKKDRLFSREEVQQLQAANPKECYLIVHNFVYNLGPYVDRHPGGRNLIMKNAGGDATRDFEALFHSQRARNILNAYCIGQIKPSERTATLSPAVARLLAAKPTSASNTSTSNDFKVPAAVARPRTNTKRDGISVAVSTAVNSSLETSIDAAPQLVVTQPTDIQEITEK